MRLNICRIKQALFKLYTIDFWFDGGEQVIRIKINSLTFLVLILLDWIYENLIEYFIFW